MASKVDDRLDRGLGMKFAEALRLALCQNSAAAEFFTAYLTTAFPTLIVADGLAMVFLWCLVFGVFFFIFVLSGIADMISRKPSWIDRLLELLGSKRKQSTTG